LIEIRTHIDEYGFGRLAVGSQEYFSDVILWPDRLRDRWWRKKGHSLCVEDLKEVLENPPERLLIGLGCYGQMKIPAETLSILEERGVELTAMKTGNAVKTWNEWIGESIPSAAGLHLTC